MLAIACAESIPAADAAVTTALGSKLGWSEIRFLVMCSEFLYVTSQMYRTATQLSRGLPHLASLGAPHLQTKKLPRLDLISYPARARVLLIGRCFFLVLCCSRISGLEARLSVPSRQTAV